MTESVCRQRADEVYQLRHPEAVYTEDTYTSSLRNSPLGTSGLAEPSHARPERPVQHDQLVTDCIRGTGPVGPTPAAPPLAGPEATP